MIRKGGISGGFYVLFSLLMLISGGVGFSATKDATAIVVPECREIYSQMQLASVGLHQEIFDKAYSGWQKMQGPNRLLSIADFSQSSNAKRLYIIDVEKRMLLFQTYVAHGRNSGEEFASSFSNVAESYQSSPGFYVTGELYNGKHGLSMQLKGLEPGVNDRAEQRAIVMHGAHYVSESFIQKFGRLGRSQGCPAVPVEMCEPIVMKIKGGSCFFIYTPKTGA